MADKAKKSKTAQTVARELSGQEGYPEIVTIEMVCEVIGKNPKPRALVSNEDEQKVKDALKALSTETSRPRRERQTRRRKSTGTGQSKMTQEERDARDAYISWLVLVQALSDTFVQMEKNGTPFDPEDLQISTSDRTMVVFADRFAHLTGDPSAKRMTSFRKVEEARAQRKNVNPWSSKLREQTMYTLQALMPTTCVCGAPLREVYRVTEEDVWEFLKLKKQIPGGAGIRRPGMRRFEMNAYHPECRTMEEERVELEFQLNAMGGDTPEAVALREQRYEQLIDLVLSKNSDKGATEDNVLRAFQVFVLKQEVAS